MYSVSSILTEKCKMSFLLSARVKALHDGNESKANTLSI